jgi:hypothetical protein
VLIDKSVKLTHHSTLVIVAVVLGLRIGSARERKERLADITISAGAIATILWISIEKFF